MEWKGRRQSDNIEDDRGSAGGGTGPFGGGNNGGFSFPGGGMRRAGGGLSIGTIVVLVVIYLVLKAMGIDMLQILNQGSDMGSGSQYEQSESGPSPANDETKQFVATVLADTEDTWGDVFKSMGKTYEDPKLVLFTNRMNSACGLASTASGPFYCPSDHKVYLDMGFFQEMKNKFGASGDFAEAYVVAHEVGHHVQNLLGILPKADQARARMDESESNKMSVRIELQADCFAGVWGNRTQQKGFLEQGDLDEALNAAQQIGDDTLQKRTQGYVVPDSFNHGTSAQRVKWFKQGFDSGKITSCDTFSNPV